MGRLSGILVGIVALGLLSCGGAKRDQVIDEQAAVVPVALVVEQEIAGVVLGARLSRPFGLAIDGRGSLYCVDAGNHRIIQFHSDLTPVREIGGHGSAAGLLDGPTFAVIDNELNLLVTDEGNRRLARFDNRLTYAGDIAFYDSEDLLKFGYPSGAALTEFGELWIADRDQNRIAVFNHVGQFDRFVGDFGYSGDQVHSPEKIVVGRQGGFLVCDAGNSRLVVYDDYGNFVRSISSPELDYPIAVTIDGHGLWVVDGVVGRLFLFSHQGERKLMVGPQMSGTSIDLREPSDVAILPDGRIVVSDTGNDRLLVCRIISPER
ncbi:MAG: NHL repeat-containing protein [candidate division Zixibacteria bacterium]|nr:NHL repeat-containing protein [candidate division Zixibacteria bacterium]